MNQLTRHKRKIYQFSLTPQSKRILEEFATKYGTQKSIVVDRALELLAAKYHMTIQIHYELVDINYEALKEQEKLAFEEATNYTDEEIKHMMEVAKTKWID